MSSKSDRQTRAGPVRSGHSGRRRRGRGQKAGAPSSDGQSGHFRHRGRRRAGDLSLARVRWSSAAASRSSPARSRCGCGSPCCSPPLPKLWPKGAARRRPPTLRATRSDTIAKRLLDPTGAAHLSAVIETVPALDLRAGDVVLVEAGDVIPSDGDIIEGLASVNESAITGESAPVIREAGGDRCAVTGGTTVLSDWINRRRSVGGLVGARLHLYAGDPHRPSPFVNRRTDRRTDRERPARSGTFAQYERRGNDPSREALTRVVVCRAL